MNSNLLIYVVIMLATAGLQAQESTYRVDPGQSSITFQIKHFGFANVNGKFTDFAGELVINPEYPEQSRLNTTLQVASVDTGNNDRDSHIIEKKDYFHAEKFPRMSFYSRSVEKLKEGRFRVRGDFKLRDKIKTISFEVAAAEPITAGDKISGSTSFQIKRSDFGMKGGYPLVGDTVKISVNISAIR